MFRVLFLALSACSLAEGHSVGASIVPDPSGPYCSGSELGVTQFAAAQQIASAYCAAQGQDGIATCMAPIVTSYCPEPWRCTAPLCGDQLSMLNACSSGAEPGADCHKLFPTSATQHLVIGAAAANAQAGGPDYFGDRWIWHSYGTPLLFPLTLPPGCAITSVQHRIIKGTTSPTAIGLELVAVVDGVHTVVGATSTVGAGMSTLVVPVAHRVLPDTEYVARVTRTAGAPGVDQSLWAAVDAHCP